MPCSHTVGVCVCVCVCVLPNRLTHHGDVCVCVCVWPNQNNITGTLPPALGTKVAAGSTHMTLCDNLITGARPPHPPRDSAFAIRGLFRG